MPSPAQLDHAVINVHSDMDQAAPIFSALGFTLTQRGYHSLGSINHLMMFDSDYLELIGLPKEGETKRPEILARPLGIDGIVFKTTDADETFARLQALGMAGAPPLAFSRPVDLPDVDLPDDQKIATFRTVTVRGDVFSAGRVYFCEHGTPDLVWRPEWQTHANGATRISEIVIVSPEPASEAERYAKLVGASDIDEQDGVHSVPLADARLSVMAQTSYIDRYGALAASGAGRQSFFGALVLASPDLSALADQLNSMAEPPPAIVHAADGDQLGVSVRVAEYDCVLEFVGHE